MRYVVDVFEVVCTDDPRAPAAHAGSLYACRIERVDGKRRDELAVGYGPDKVDAVARAVDYVRYERDMMRLYRKGA
jgi:hypothetical protein